MDMKQYLEADRDTQLRMLRDAALTDGLMTDAAFELALSLLKPRTA